MRVVIQRVKSSQVTIEGRIVGKIGPGLNLLVAISDRDTETELDWIARKCLELRVFPDPQADSSRWDQSVLDIQGQLLVVSQFTLYGDCRKGRRPSFDRSAPPGMAQELYEKFVQKLKKSGLTVQTGEFGAMMQVDIVNDGPVTLILERESRTDQKLASVPTDDSGENR